MRRSLRWLRKIFPVRSCRRDLARPSRPCLEYHLGRCLAPCRGDLKREDYMVAVNGLKDFLSGKREILTKKLEKDMWSSSSEEDYERAAMVRDILGGLQKMRESEKEAVLDEFREKVGTVVTGLVQRMIGPTAVVEIGKAVAYMPPEEQIPNEFYKIGERYKFFLKEIREDQEMVVSRAAPEFLIELFKLEVPEMESDIVEIKATAREAGSL